MITLLAFLKLALHLFATAAKIVYNLLKLLRIRLLTLWLVVSAILAIFGVFQRIGIGWFWAGVGACAVITVFSWMFSVRGVLSRRRVPRKTELAPAEDETPMSEVPPPKKDIRPLPQRVKYPRWSDVADNPDYFFAEYEDRYELYYRGKNGAEYVRTDYKNEVSE